MIYDKKEYLRIGKTKRRKQQERRKCEETLRESTEVKNAEIRIIG